MNRRIVSIENGLVEINKPTYEFRADPKHTGGANFQDSSISFLTHRQVE